MGRSINERRDAPHRYRFCAKSFPPKFGLPNKKPLFETDKRPADAQPSAAAPLKILSRMPSPAMPPSQQQSISQPAAARSVRVRRLPRFNLRRLSAFFQQLYSALLRRISRPRISTVKSNPLQPELSLDAVKVIRNDLSDADLEVVAIKKCNPSPQQEMVPITSGLQSLAMTKREATSAVGRVTTRLMAVLNL